MKEENDGVCGRREVEVEQLSKKKKEDVAICSEPCGLSDVLDEKLPPMPFARCTFHFFLVITQLWTLHRFDEALKVLLRLRVCVFVRV